MSPAALRQLAAEHVKGLACLFEEVGRAFDDEPVRVRLPRGGDRPVERQGLRCTLPIDRAAIAQHDGR